MAQPPFQADAIQIEPGSGQTLLIERDAATGSLRFTDALVTGGINLTDLSGVGSLGEVFVAGKTGAGAKYTTVQSAINAAPTTATKASPVVILIGPGTYIEDLLIDKDGLILVGMGGVSFSNATATATLTVQIGGSTTPRSLTLQNIKLANTANGQACLKLIGGAGSLVAEDYVDLIGVDLEATGIGGYQIDAEAVNRIRVRGGTWAGSATSSLSWIRQVALFEMLGVGWVNNLQLEYDTTGAIPNTAGSAYSVVGSADVGNLVSTMNGAGSIRLDNCPNVGTITFSGSQGLTAVASKLGNMTLNNSTTATLRHSSRGTVTGTGTLAETLLTGSVAFAGTSLESVVFGAPQPDINYTVAVEREVDARVVVKNKATTGFDIEFPAGVQTTTVYYAVSRS